MMAVKISLRMADGDCPVGLRSCTKYYGRYLVVHGNKCYLSEKADPGFSAALILFFRHNNNKSL